MAPSSRNVYGTGERGKEIIMDSANNQKTPARAWGILAISYIASWAAALAQFKVPALADSLIPSVIVGAAGGDPVLIGTYFGLLMSALTIIALVLAFPASYISNKIGLKNTVLISIVCLIVGTAMAIPDSFALLMAGRFLEGIGIGLIGVVGPSCVAIWFPLKTRGTAMAIWATWVPLAIIVAFPLGPILAHTAFGYHALYYVCIAIDVLAFILFALFFRLPEGAKQDNEAVNFKQGWKYLKSPVLWVICIVFFCYNFLQLGAFSNFYSVFLTENGWSPLDANNVVSACYGIGIITAVIGGVAYDRMKKKNYLWVFSFVLWIIGLLFMFRSGDNMALTVWLGFVLVTATSGGIAAASLRPAAAASVPNTALGATMSMGLLQVFQNLGAAVGSPLYGAVSGSLGYESAGYILLIPLCVIAVILSIVLGNKALRRKQEALMAEWEDEITSARKNSNVLPENNHSINPAAPATSNGSANI